MTTLLTPERTTQREPVKEPAKLWRNQWLVVIGEWQRVCARCGREHFANTDLTITWSCLTHPSRELAENHASAQVPQYAGVAQYLGAFPVDAP